MDNEPTLAEEQAQVEQLQRQLDASGHATSPPESSLRQAMNRLHQRAAEVKAVFFQEEPKS